MPASGSASSAARAGPWRPRTPLSAEQPAGTTHPGTSTAGCAPGWCHRVLPGCDCHLNTEALRGLSHAADPKTSPQFAGGPFRADCHGLNDAARVIGDESDARPVVLVSRSLCISSLKTAEVSPWHNDDADRVDDSPPADIIVVSGGPHPVQSRPSGGALRPMDIPMEGRLTAAVNRHGQRPL